MDVFIDMDSTMNNFASGYINYYNKRFGTNVSLTKTHLTNYEISKCIPGLPEDEAVRARNDIFGTPNFWIDLPIYPGVREAVEWISNNFNTYILTAPWIPYKDCAKEKYIWIENHLPFFPLDKVIFCHDKHLINKDSLLIDDHVKHIEGFKGKTLKINYPYNNVAAATYDADDWFEILKVMKSIK